MPESQPAEAGRRGRIVKLLLALILLALASGIGFAGVKALREKSYTLSWRSSGALGLGPLTIARDSTGAEHYVDGEAVRMGLGLLCFAGMLLVWGVALLFRQGGTWGMRHSFLSMASLACLLAAVILIFPPWRILSDAGCAALYAVLFLAAVLAVVLKASPGKAYGKWACLAVIAGAVALSPYSKGLSVGAILGMISAMAIAVHIGLLSPKLRS